MKLSEKDCRPHPHAWVALDLLRPDYTENGCLMAYGPSYSIAEKDRARYMTKMLRGAKPADIPAEQPLRFEVMINLQTAHKLGLTIPQLVLFQTDKIIR